ncbi:MAG TPA: triphosphoribosyl-dephospho-CoA synthase [Methanotrichaceae archaeon]|nr:triphosphoribosyl-dephospho-CoA synthase [Methanotrichaceae archaeon]
MSTDPDRVAQCAQLAMLLELSSSPKPGNVDRCHDFSDIGFHHFLISAVSAYPIFRAAASGEGTDEGTGEGTGKGGTGSLVGSLILKGVKAWSDWNISSNTHFGSLVLMVPLAIAAGRPGPLREELIAVLKGTSVEDALDFYRAFSLAGARVADVEDFSLKDPAFAEELRREDRTLLDLMCLSQGHDLIAREWATSYERSFRLAKRLEERLAGRGLRGLNEGVVRTFLEALAETPDSLVWAKFGEVKAREVSLKAGLALEDGTLEAARRLDQELLAEDINPGSTADLVAASLFISLLKGLRF